MVDLVRLRRGVDLFNAGRFFDCHEVWEDVWRSAPAAEKSCLQGLVQIAVGLHHFQSGNMTGARSVLARGLGRLEECPDVIYGVDVAGLRAAVKRWQEAVVRGETPVVPRLGCG